MKHEHITRQQGRAEVAEQLAEQGRQQKQASQEQDLKEFYRTIFTLKSGNTIEILHEEPFIRTVSELKNFSGVTVIVKGFIATPLIVEKSIEIMVDEIAAVESTKEPHITWLKTELDPDYKGTHLPVIGGTQEPHPVLKNLDKEVDPGKHPEDCMCGSCHPTTLEIKNTVKSTIIKIPCPHKDNCDCEVCKPLR